MTGQIELHIDLYYDPTKVDTESDVSEESSAATDSVFGDMGVEIVDTQSEMTETEGIATRMQTRAPTFDTDNNAETEEMADIKEGDYQIKVHVIEVRDLKGLNLNGTSDPIVKVDLMGQQRYTRVKFGVAAVFDETFIFQFKELTIEDVEGAECRFTVCDHERLRRNQTIGSFQVDISSVYLAIRSRGVPTVGCPCK